MRLCILSIMIAGTAIPFSPTASRITLPVYQEGDSAAVRIDSVGFSQTTLASDLTLSFTNNGRQALRAAVFQVRYFDQQGSQLSSAIVLGNFGTSEAFDQQDDRFRDWLRRLVGENEWDQWYSGRGSNAPGGSITMLYVGHEILRQPPSTARVAVLAHASEGQEWHFGPVQFLNRRAIPDRLTVEKDDYRKLAECCSCCTVRDIVVSVRLSESGVSQVREVTPKLGTDAEQALRHMVTQWKFLPRLVEGRAVPQDITLLVLIARTNERRDLSSVPLDTAAHRVSDVAIMPIMISEGSIWTWLHN
jgi:hypothetical protein